MNKKLLLLILFLPIVFSATYFPKENVNFIVSLTDVYGNVIENAKCYGYVYFPNGTLFLELELKYDNNLKVYKNTFEIPEVYGTYLQYAFCEFELFGRTQRRSTYNTFFVSNLKERIDEFISNLIANATINITADITGNITESLMTIKNEIGKDIEDLVGLLLALHSTPETYRYCKDNNTLVIVKYSQWNVNNKTYNITKTEEIKCPYGCNFNTNECKSPQYMNYLIIAGILFAILIIFLIVRAYL